MGQQVSVTLNDSFKSTDVYGNRVVCTKEFNCTNTTKETMASDAEPVRVTLKVTRRPRGHVFLGVVGTRADKTELSRRVVGEAELVPSLGCGICDREVVLYFKDKVFFKGSCDTRDPTFITMRMHNKQLTFFIDGREVNSDELEGMKLSGSFHIGVSLTKPGQEAEIVEVLTGPGALEKPSFSGGDLARGDATGQMIAELAKLAAGSQGSSSAGTSPSSSPPRSSGQKPHFTALREGMTVVRNPKCWKWDDQDGNGTGKVMEVPDSDGWVRVGWKSGRKNNYRFGAQGAYDVMVCPAEGDKVVRNPTYWSSGNADGGEGNTGVVVERAGGELQVKWDSGRTVGHTFDLEEQEVQYAGSAPSKKKQINF